MQRLYLTFPGGLPGLGLLLLRVTEAVLSLRGMPLTQSDWIIAAGSLIPIVKLISAILLATGLWTPLIAFAEFALAVPSLIDRGFDEGRIALSVIALSLIFLGPGAFSIDARIFGRRRIDLHGLSD